jgi:hypothetical protein
MAEWRSPCVNSTRRQRPADEARDATQAGLSLNPTLTISRVRASASSDNPTFLAQRERLFDGWRKAGAV